MAAADGIRRIGNWGLGGIATGVGAAAIVATPSGELAFPIIAPIFGIVGGAGGLVVGTGAELINTISGGAIYHDHQMASGTSGNGASAPASSSNPIAAAPGGAPSPPEGMLPPKESDKDKSNPSGISAQRNAFENLFPEKLQSELDKAKDLGITPAKPGTTEFNQMANDGTIKWVVTKDGELQAVPKVTQGWEVPHTVASGGAPVLSAGEADIATSESESFGIQLNNHSGHYEPSADSLKIGQNAFEKQGIKFDDQHVNAEPESH